MAFFGCHCVLESTARIDLPYQLCTESTYSKYIYTPSNLPGLTKTISPWIVSVFVNLILPREANINLHMCFIDYSKAFDCVGHREMIEALKQMNCHYKITNLKINLYQEQLAAVRLESGLRDWFPVKRGVRQGCILSPPIFSMYTDNQA